MREDGFYFGAEIKISLIVREIKRLDAHAVAQQYQAAAVLGPESGGVHSSQFRERASIPFKEGVEQNFGIAARMKLVPEGFQFAAQFAMVVDFAVINQGRVVRA